MNIPRQEQTRDAPRPDAPTAGWMTSRNRSVMAPMSNAPAANARLLSAHDAANGRAFASRMAAARKASRSVGETTRPAFSRATRRAARLEAGAESRMGRPAQKYDCTFEGTEKLP